MGSFNVVADISVFDQRRKLCLHSISTASQVMDCPFQNSQWIRTIELIWNSLISSCYKVLNLTLNLFQFNFFFAQLRSLRKLQDQSIVFNICLQFRWMFYNSLQGCVVKVVWSSDLDPSGITRDIGVISLFDTLLGFSVHANNDGIQSSQLGRSFQSTWAQLRYFVFILQAFLLFQNVAFSPTN